MAPDPETPDLEDPDLTLADLFRAWPEAARPFLRRRMGCPGCPIAPFHTVADACAEYRLDEATFRAELRAAIRPPNRPAPRGDGPPSR